MRRQERTNKKKEEGEERGRENLVALSRWPPVQRTQRPMRVRETFSLTHHFDPYLFLQLPLFSIRTQFCISGFLPAEIMHWNASTCCPGEMTHGCPVRTAKHCPLFRPFSLSLSLSLFSLCRMARVLPNALYHQYRKAKKCVSQVRPRLIFEITIFKCWKFRDEWIDCRAQNNIIFLVPFSWNKVAFSLDLFMEQLFLSRVDRI